LKKQKYMPRVDIMPKTTTTATTMPVIYPGETGAAPTGRSASDGGELVEDGAVVVIASLKQ
jgi:hypothetical protein